MLCAACNATLADGARFCSACGAPVAAAAPPRQGGEGERRHVTVLFADMEGYTTLAEKLGEEGTYALMKPVLARMVETIHAHGGRTQDLAGDGVMALFGAPHALEDAPVRACAAALDLHHRLADLAEGIRGKHGVTPRFRVGLHAGPVVLGQMGEGERIEFRAVGDTVNLASRLQALAEPGTVLLSEEVHRLVDGYVEDVSLGERSVKGKAGPVRVYRLDAVRGGVSRFQLAVQRGLTELVGRERELERMEVAWSATRGGSCRALGLRGEAGLGKSRLVHEFCERRASEQAFVLRAGCVPNGRATPFLPFADLVRSSFRVGDADSREAAASRLKRGLEILGAEAVENVQYLVNLLGFAVEGEAFSKENAEVVGIRTRDLLLLLIKERCQASEVVLVIEDLQWIDRASEALLARLLAEGERLLVICSYRPPYEPPWAQRTNAEEIRLEPLSAALTEALLRKHLHADELPRELVALVVSRAEGNPLFAEEIARYLSERGALRRGEADLAFDAALARALPVSLENMLLERTEQLDEASRSLLQAAAVVGRRFSLEVATRAAKLDGAGAASVAKLQSLQLVVPEAEPGAFRFASALLQEAVYQSLLSTRREELHGSVAAALEDRYGERAAEIADQLAYHYVATPRAEKAVVYMRLAGEKALRMYSLDEAALRFRQVIELIEKVPGCANDVFLVDTLLNVSRVLYYKAAFNELIGLIARHLPLAERLGDPGRLGRFLFELGYAHCFNADPAVGKPLLERALAIGEANGDERLVAYAAMGLMWEQIYWEPPTRATREATRSLAVRAEAIGRQLADHWVMVKVIAALAIEDLVSGRPAGTRREGLRLIEYSRETGDPRGRSMGLYLLAYGDAFSYDFAGAIGNADESMRIGLSPIDRVVAQAAKAWALVLAERAAEALPLLEALTGQVRREGFTQLRYTTDAALGIAQVATGAWTRGVRTIEDLIARAESRGMRRFCAFGHYALGEVYVRMALREGKAGWREFARNLVFALSALPRAAAKARRHLDMACSLAREVDSPSVLAKALHSLGRLELRKSGAARGKPLLAQAHEIAVANDLDELARRIGAER